LALLLDRSISLGRIFHKTKEHGLELSGGWHSAKRRTKMAMREKRLA
jgi:hypothetical protein